MATAADRRADAWVASGGASQERVNSVIDRANSGDTGGFTARDWAIVRANPGFTTPAAAASQQPQGGTDTGTTNVPTYDEDFETRRMREQMAAQAALDAAAEANRRQNATAVMRALLTEMNLSSLYDRAVQFIQDGYNTDAIMVLIRTTPEYKQRFPAMEALAARGRAISESEYIEYEQTAAGLERRYGLPAGMLMGSVTDLLTNGVSATELNDRVLLASAASIQAPDDVKRQFRDFYGVDEGGLTGYFLDPDRATPLLEKQYASALIGVEAARQGVGVDVYGAENLAELGVTQEQARTGFGQIARAQPLTQGRGDVVTQQELMSGTFQQNEEALRSIERASRARTGRFQEGGQFATEREGVAGLGTAATR